MKKKYKYKVGTHVGTDYRWAFSARQAIYIVWLEQKAIGSRLSWRQALKGWTAEEMQ